jgi:hypothetical protein
MSRDLAGGLQTETLAAQLSPVLFLAFDTAAGTSRAWTGVGTIAWDGADWTGLGNLLGVSAIQETGDVQANGVSISLSGVPAALVSLALVSVRQGKAVKIWLGALNASGGVIADPYLVFQGRFDTASIAEGGDSATITVQAENRLIDLERARTRRYTPEDQAIDYPGDKGLAFVASIQDIAIIWK